jgi:hypothetical protein
VPVAEPRIGEHPERGHDRELAAGDPAQAIDQSPKARSVAASRSSVARKRCRGSRAMASYSRTTSSGNPSITWNTDPVSYSNRPVIPCSALRCRQADSSSSSSSLEGCSHSALT